VLKIDEVAGSVQVKDYGVITNLTFAANGVKQPSGILPAAGGVIPAPGNPYAPGAGRNLPGMPGMPGASGLPSRPLRTGMPGQADGGAVNPTGGSAAYGSGAYQPPGFAQPQGVAQAAPMSLEEQTILIEAERMRNKDAIASGRAPPLPNTLVTREADAAANAAAGNTGTLNTGAQGPILRRAPSLPPLPQ
jgi:hypothetical protein